MMKLLNIAGWGLFIWLIFLDPPFLSYQNLPFPVEHQRVRPGDSPRPIVERCNSDSITRLYTVAHELVRVDAPAKNVILPSAQVSIAPGCDHVSSTISVVPPGTAPGRYYVSGHGEARGMIRTHIVPWRSAVFEVVP